MEKKIQEPIDREAAMRAQAKKDEADFNKAAIVAKKKIGSGHLVLSGPTQFVAVRRLSYKTPLGFRAFVSVAGIRGDKGSPIYTVTAGYQAPTTRYVPFSWAALRTHDFNQAMDLAKSKELPNQLKGLVTVFVK